MTDELKCPCAVYAPAPPRESRGTIPKYIDAVNALNDKQAARIAELEAQLARAKVLIKSSDLMLYTDADVDRALLTTTDAPRDTDDGRYFIPFVNGTARITGAVCVLSYNFDGLWVRPVNG